jgi:hypothetical protein
MSCSLFGGYTTVDHGYTGHIVADLAKSSNELTENWCKMNFMSL